MVAEKEELDSGIGVELETIMVLVEDPGKEEEGKEAEKRSETETIEVEGRGSLAPRETSERVALPSSEKERRQTGEGNLQLKTTAQETDNLKINVQDETLQLNHAEESTLLQRIMDKTSLMTRIDLNLIAVTQTNRTGRIDRTKTSMKALSPNQVQKKKWRIRKEAKEALEEELAA